MIAVGLFLVLPLGLYLLSQLHEREVNREISTALTEALELASSTTERLSDAVLVIKPVQDFQDIEELHATNLAWRQVRAEVKALCTGIRSQLNVPESLETRYPITHSCGILIRHPDMGNPDTFLFVNSENKADKTLTFSSEVVSTLRKDADRREATVLLTSDSNVTNVIMAIRGSVIFLVLGNEGYLSNFK